MGAVDFTCACCGERIEGLPDIGFDAPLHYHQMTEADRRAHSVRLTGDLCVIGGEDHFVRAVCPLPIAERKEHFAWGIWVSLSRDNFQRYEETITDIDQSRLGPMFGWFCNRLPLYPDTLHLKTTLVPRDDNQRPEVWISEAHADHPLYREQREGITLQRLGEIYGSLACPNGGGRKDGGSGEAN